MKTLCLMAAGIAFCLSLASCDKPAGDPQKTVGQATQKVAAPATPTSAAPFQFAGAWEKDIHDGLTALMSDHSLGGSQHKKGQPAPVVVFDFDNTVIKGDIGRAFFDFMVTEGKIEFSDQVVEALPADKREEVKATWEALDKLPADRRKDSREAKVFRKIMHKVYWSLCQDADAEKCYPWQVRFYAGHRPEELEALAGQVMQAELKRPMGPEQIRIDAEDPAPAITSRGIRIYGEMRDLMNHLRQRGFEIWIVSAGPEWVVRGAVKSHFPIEPERVIGMRTRLADGKLTSEVESPPTFRMGKVEAIDKRIGRRPLLAVGDSWSDADMLGQAEKALLIDRGYLDLKKKAVEAGWWIQPGFPVE